MIVIDLNYDIIYFDIMYTEKDITIFLCGFVPVINKNSSQAKRHCKNEDIHVLQYFFYIPSSFNTQV